jgi:hypothetical protein
MQLKGQIWGSTGPSRPLGRVLLGQNRAKLLDVVDVPVVKGIGRRRGSSGDAAKRMRIIVANDARAQAAQAVAASTDAWQLPVGIDEYVGRSDEKGSTAAWSCRRASGAAARRPGSSTSAESASQVEHAG